MPLIPERWDKPFDVCSQKAIIEATMHFPLEADIDKRMRLACFFDFHRAVDIDLLASDDDETYGARHVILGYEGRYLDEFMTTFSRKHSMPPTGYATASMPADMLRN